MPELVIDDAGLIGVTIRGKRVEVDAYEANLRLVMLSEEADAAFPGEENRAKATHAYFARVCELLAELGFEGVSHYHAHQFEKAIFGAVDELKKKQRPEPTPASPPSTAPPS